MIKVILKMRKKNNNYFQYNFFFSESKISKLNHYDILELKSNCSQREIRKNYIRLAKIYHPDIYKGSDKDRFKKLQEAYEILKNPEKRIEYDSKIDINKNTNENKSDFYNNDNINKNGPSFYKNWDVEKNFNLEEEYNKFMKKPRIHEPAGTVVSEDPFLSQLNFQERLRFEFVLYRNNKELYHLKYGHQQGYDKTVNDTIEILNIKKNREIDSEKFRQDEEIKMKKIEKQQKIANELIFFLIIVPSVAFIAYRHGLSKRVEKIVEKKIDEIDTQNQMKSIRERIVFE